MVNWEVYAQRGLWLCVCVRKREGRREGGREGDAGVETEGMWFSERPSEALSSLEHSMSSGRGHGKSPGHTGPGRAWVKTVVIIHLALCLESLQLQSEEEELQRVCARRPPCTVHPPGLPGLEGGSSQRWHLSWLYFSGNLCCSSTWSRRVTLPLCSPPAWLVTPSGGGGEKEGTRGGKWDKQESWI